MDVEHYNEQTFVQNRCTFWLIPVGLFCNKLVITWGKSAEGFVWNLDRQKLTFMDLCNVYQYNQAQFCLDKEMSKKEYLCLSG